MAIHNINMLQRQEDVKYLIGDIEDGNNNTIHYPTDNTKDFYIQSLANMGQRVGTRTNGIKYGSMSIKNIVKNVFGTEIDNIVKIQYSFNDYTNTTKANISAISYNESTDSIDNITSTNEIGDNIKHKYYLDNITEFSVPINNIAKYAKDSIIYNDGDYMIMCMYGQILGTAEDDINNVELQYTKIDLQNNVIDSAIRAWALSDKEYAMLVMTPSETNVKDSEYKYIMSLYIMDLNNVISKFENNENAGTVDDIQTNILNIFTWSECNKNDTDNNIFNFNFFKNDITQCSVDELLEYNNEFYSGDKLNTTIFALIKQFTNWPNKKIYSEVIYNSETDVQFSFTNETQTEEGYRLQHNLLINDVYGLEGRLVCITNDLLHTYPNLLHVYSNNKYSRLTDVFTQILYTLYEHLCDNYVYDLNIKNYPILYLPADYVIEYMYNSLNNNIYYTDNIFVTFVNNEEYIDTNGFEDYISKNGLNVITFLYDDDSKVSSFKFVVNYNDKYDEFINTISIKEEFTLPYINSLNNWQINNKDSNLSAIGKDAGNPNIIISKTVKTTDDDYIHKLIVGSNFDILESCEWYLEKYNIDENNIGYAYVPKLTTSNTRYLDNALLFNIYFDGTKNSTSIWSINTDEYYSSNNIDNKFKFTYVKSFEDNADTLSALKLEELFSLSDVVKTIIHEEDIINNNKFKEIEIQSATNTLEHDTAEEELDYITCHIHGELEGKDDDDNSSNAIYNNDTILKIYYDKIANQHYLRSKNSESDNLMLNNSDIYPDRYKIYKINTDQHDEYHYVEQNDNSSATHSSLSNGQYGSGAVTEQYGENVNSSQMKEIVDSTFTNNFIEDYSTYTYEYIPANNIPSLQLGEMLLQDINTLNRTNIITIGKQDINDTDNKSDYKVYNSYIGSSFLDENKNVLHIGSCSYNINIGTNTLIEPGYNQNFYEQDTLSLDLKYTYINSKSIVKTTNDIVTDHITVNSIDTTYNFLSPCIISPVSQQRIKLDKSSDNIYSFSSTTEQSFNHIEDDYNNNILFKGLILQNGSSDGGLIFINSLIKKYLDININDYIKEDNSMTLSVKYPGETQYYTWNSLEEPSELKHILRVIHNAQIYLYISINKELNTEIEYMNIPIYIMYYINDKHLYIDINLKATDYTDNKTFIYNIGEQSQMVPQHNNNMSPTANENFINHGEFVNVNRSSQDNQVNIIP